MTDVLERSTEPGICAHRGKATEKKEAAACPQRREASRKPAWPPAGRELLASRAGRKKDFCCSVTRSVAFCRASLANEFTPGANHSLSSISRRAVFLPAVTWE